MKPFLIGTFVVAALTSSIVSAQPPGNTSVRLDQSAITGTIAIGDTLFLAGTGGIAKFPLRFTNRDTVGYSVTNAFVISSPDGAVWGLPTANGGNYKFATPTAGVWVDTLGHYSLSEFGAEFKFDCLSCDGQDADTVIFTATSNPGQIGAPPLDSGDVFQIALHLYSADTCKTICFDSAAHTPTADTWKWTSTNFTPEYSTVPAWNSRCFKLRKLRNCRGCFAAACCVGLTGNVDCDPENRVDISDLVRLIDYAYISQQPLCCPQAANIDGDGWGGVDISDISRLIQYLYIDGWWPAECPTQSGGC